MARAQEHPAQLPALPRIPPVADQAPFVVIPNPGVPKTRRFCAFWSGNPAAVWTGARSGLGTPVESAGLQTPGDLLFPTLKSEISDLPFLPFSSAASSDSGSDNSTENANSLRMRTYANRSRNSFRMRTYKRVGRGELGRPVISPLISLIPYMMTKQPDLSPLE
jgi:hypothetical protein